MKKRVRESTVALFLTAGVAALILTALFKGMFPLVKAAMSGIFIALIYNLTVRIIFSMRNKIKQSSKQFLCFAQSICIYIIMKSTVSTFGPQNLLVSIACILVAVYAYRRIRNDTKDI